LDSLSYFLRFLDYSCSSVPFPLGSSCSLAPRRTTRRSSSGTRRSRRHCAAHVGTPTLRPLATSGRWRHTGFAAPSSEGDRQSSATVPEPVPAHWRPRVGCFLHAYSRGLPGLIPLAQRSGSRRTILVWLKRTTCLAKSDSLPPVSTGKSLLLADPVRPSSHRLRIYELEIGKSLRRLEVVSNTISHKSLVASCCLWQGH